jgi:hypothetical protein
MTVRSLAWGTFALLVLGMGCSDPEAPPARGAVRAQIAAPAQAPAGTTCTTSGTTLLIGDATRADASGRVTDGSGGDIKCSVVGGETFDVSVSAYVGNDNFTARATIDKAAGTGTGSVTVYTFNSGGLSSKSDTPCTFAPMQIGPGLVWTKFTCSALVAKGSPSTTCAIYDGYIAFDNCAK